MKYLTEEGGFEWFGVSPAHEALSAYGLMEFTDMAKVSNIVDSRMLSNLKEWLMSRRNGTGHFNTSDEYHWHSFGHNGNTTDAYITWALTSSGETNLTQEVDSLIERAEDSIMR